jgi:xanthine phosphoribosyltransferase
MSTPSSGPGAAALRRAVLERGRVEGPLVKVDDFLNHRVEPDLMAAIGADLAALFPVPDLILTAEASGIPPALLAASALGVPMVYAKKYPRSHSVRPTHVRVVGSATKGEEYRIEVAHRVLPAGSRVVVIDDFLSGGRTAEALGEIVEEAGCTLVGFGFVIEKAFAEGRARLEGRGWSVAALLQILSIEGGLVLGSGSV